MIMGVIIVKQTKNHDEWLKNYQFFRHIYVMPL
jgi:hypothetical protein